MPLVQVTPEAGGWKVVSDGEQQGSTYSTQAEAEQAGRDLAKQLGAEFQLHGEDGQIRVKDSYGNDPRDVKG